MTTNAPGFRRRSLLCAGLGAGLAGLLTACGGASPATPSNGRPGGTVDPDPAVRARALRATLALAAQYDATLAEFPSLNGRLAPLRAQLKLQAAVFAATTGGRTSPSAGTAPTASASHRTPGGSKAPAAPSAAPTPADSGAAVLALDRAERDTVRSRLADLTGASPALARRLASAAAAGAQHSMVLRGSVAPAPVPAPLSRAPLPAAALQALQAALAAEDAAVYGYGVIAARLSGGRRSLAARSYQAHRDRRDALVQRIGSSGARPVAAAAAYELPSDVTGDASGSSLAALIEDRVSAVYANAVQATAGALRGTVATSLRQAALDTLSWRGTGSAFPGIPG